jgi:hypothetical protein
MSRQFNRAAALTEPAALFFPGDTTAALITEEK